MLDSINCEPYGFIKHEHYDLNFISINEVEDVTIKTEDIEIQEVETYIQYQKLTLI